MSLLRFSVAGVLQLTLCAAACLAASTPNFSGTWTLDASASKLHTSPKTVNLVIKHQDPNMEVETTTPGLKDRRSYKLDGVKRKEDVSGIEMELCAKWKDSSLETRADAAGMTQVDIWQLQDGGKTLSINRTVSGMVSLKELLIYRKH